jgi:hypothetical protein
MAVDTSKWSGEGAFTQIVIDQLAQMTEIANLRVEDAPASRSDADYNFVSNEIFVAFATAARREAFKRFGFLPASRTVHEKLVELVRIYDAAAPLRAEST